MLGVQEDTYNTYVEYLKNSYVYGRLGATDGIFPDDNALTRLSDLKSAINTVRNFIVSNDYDSDCIEKLEGIFDASLTKIDEYVNMIHDNLNKLLGNANRGDAVLSSYNQGDQYGEAVYYTVANAPVSSPESLVYVDASGKSRAKKGIKRVLYSKISEESDKEGYIKVRIKEDVTTYEYTTPDGTTIHAQFKFNQLCIDPYISYNPNDYVVSKYETKYFDFNGNVIAEEDS